MKTRRVILAIYICVLSLLFQRMLDKFAWVYVGLNYVPILLIVLGIFIEIILSINDNEKK